MPARNLDDLVDPSFNRQSLRFTFISGVFGGISSVCSCLAIQFAASLAHYNTAILVCLLTGVSFLTMCIYCFRAGYRLRLDDFIYPVGQPQRFPRLYDPSESADMRNEDTGDDSMFFPLEDVPQQLEDSSFANLETNPVCPSGDASEVHSEETLPSTSVQKSSDIKSEPMLKKFFHQPSTDILTKSSSKGKLSRKISSYSEREPEKLCEQSTTESIEETCVASASKPDISGVREEASISDGRMLSESDTRSVRGFLSDFIANFKIFNKVMNEPSDTSSSTENEAAKCKKDTRSSSGSLDSVKMDNKDVLSFKQESNSECLEIKRSSSEKDVTSRSKAQWAMKVYDSIRSGKGVPEYFKRRVPAPQRDSKNPNIFSSRTFPKHDFCIVC
ncbi:hypothetical protein TNIN_321621 [Trichonephila inaurata madagascariensis]|uniref:Uncharacterized protein n=1 Tax=Trichonephila inaurata madagascariensis TaxID=2747483 RepID=A0A8X6YN34_9ARAC|nr:hypothetical protein TNIN_321621 [Trichonephila inaurata madagascariensis]